MDPISWAERKEAGAQSTYQAAQEALARVRKLLKDGEERKAKDAAIALGILLDKSGILEEAAAQAQQRQVRLAEGQGQRIAVIVRMFFEACGIPWSMGPRRLVRDLIGQGEDCAVIAASPELVEAARAEVREHVARELRDVEAGERLALPAGGDDALVVDAVPAGVDDEPVPDREPDVEVVLEPVEAEVVDEDPAHPVVGRNRRPAWTREVPPAYERHADPHSIFGPGSNMRGPGGHV